MKNPFVILPFRFVVTSKWLLLTSLILFFFIAIVSCGDDNYGNDNKEGATDNTTNWGTPKKLARQTVSDTLEISFAVFGDPQPDLNMYGIDTYCNWQDLHEDKMKRIATQVDHINKSADEATNFIGIVGVGDLTQHSCVQELIAFRQFFENDYPGNGGGSIACADDDDDDHYTWGYRVKYPVFPGLGNHGDPSRTLCSDQDCHDMNNLECYSNYVYKYIKARVFGSNALYDPSSTLNVHQPSYYESGSGDIYAWEWGSYHFIHGNIWMFYHGEEDQYQTSAAKKHWLMDYLEHVIGDSGKPVILFQHYGWDGQSFRDGWHDHNAEDLINVLYNNGKPYNVIGIFTGHVHQFDYHSIDAGGNAVTFDNYVVNDSGPANGDYTGHFIVQLSPDPNNPDKGKMEIYKHIIDYYDGRDKVNLWRYKKELWKTKSFNLSFSGWDQGEPNNDHGTESCAGCKSNGRFNDLDCNSLKKVACMDSNGEWAITDDKHTWFDAPGACKGLGKFEKPSTVEDQYNLMKLINESNDGESVWINTRSGWIARHQIPGWFGGKSEGAGITMGDIDGDENSRPELIVTHINNPSGGNHGYYRIGWNIDKKGSVSSWTDPIEIIGWFGDNSAGAGIAMGDIDANGTPELIATHIAERSGGNHGYYRIGWNINKEGKVSSWGDQTKAVWVVGWFGDNTAGAGITVGDIDGDLNHRPDLIITHINNPDGEDRGYYRVGLNINEKGLIMPFSADVD